MLTRSNQVASQDEYYADSLLKMPTLSDTVFHNLALGIATPVVALNMLDKDFAKKPDGHAILNAFNSTQLENDTPGMSTSQWLLGEGANMLGFGLNPVTWGLGEAGGLATKGLVRGAARVAPDAASVFMRQPIKNLVSKSIGSYIPEMIGREGAEKPLSLGLMSEETLKNFGIFAGAGVPQGIVDNYKADTGHIEWGGVAREMGEMGAFGMAIGSIPFAYGVLRGKINRALDRSIDEPVNVSALDEALGKGHITKVEHQWYSDYLEYQKDPSNIELSKKLQADGTEIINKNGHTANSVSNEAMFEILKPDDVSNLQGVIADQLAGNVPDEYKKSLSDFIIHNRLDYMRQNPKWLDGVRGYVDFIDQKLQVKDEKLQVANEILDKNLLKSVKENMPFSQKELFKSMKKAGFESSHIQHLPVTIPENMTRMLKMQEKVSKLQEKLKIEQKRQSKIPKIKTEVVTNTISPNQFYIKSEFGSIDLIKHGQEVKVEGVGVYSSVFKKGSKIETENPRGKGYGKALYKAAIEYAESKGLKFVSDQKVSPEAMRVYESLEKLGYRFKKNPTTYLETKSPREREHYSVTNAKPVFELISSPKPNRQTVKRIAELESKMPKIMTPKEELEHIRGKLLGEKGLPKNFERSNEYNRLLDLSNVWHNARTLLDRVHLEHEYNRQTAFRDLTHQVLRVSDSNMPRIARPENVMDYMRRRIEGNLNKLKPISEIKNVLNEREKVPSDADTILNEQGNEIRNTQAREAKDEFTQSTDRFKEFKESEGIFKNLISCVMGGVNG